MSSASFNPKEPIVTVGPGGTTSPGKPTPGTGTTLNPSEPLKILPTTAKLVGIGGDTLNGVYGGSTKQTGVWGESTEGVGVTGFGPWGVLGLSTDGDGVVGNGRRGVVGESQTFQGVYGKSRDNAGVVGESEKFHAVYGVSHSSNNGGVIGINNSGGWGVIGRSDANTGISGESTSGVGVHGKGGKLAGFFEGDVEVTGKLESPTVNDLLQRINDLKASIDQFREISIVNSDAGGMHIGSPASFVPLSLTVSKPGLYIVFARVAISNDDGDAQQASARISHDEEFVIDRVDVRIPGNARMSLSLQGMLQIVPNAPKVLNLRCETFNGGANQSSIVAIRVSEFGR